MDNSQIAPPIEPEENKTVDSYLSFYLNDETRALLLMKYAQEIIVVPQSRLTPMPNMPECVLGLLNRRSRVLWVVNLAQLLHLPAPDSIAQQYQIVIMQVEQVKLGLVVQSVKGVTHFSSKSNQEPTELLSYLAPYANGCMTQGDENLIVLEAKEIAYSPNLKPISCLEQARI
ncbi:MAG: chemotaxis protein CheW [Chroococcus sp. CMT-3BRIN-NPC107]|jgi:twitching motility protein PilI|nr:chemotaxis protein CheW [Chroococcus sp. CMT-3BRIN-NPC107]